MKDKIVGGTAHWIAAVRAFETLGEKPLFLDPFADNLSGEIGRIFKDSSEAVTGGKNQFIVVRTRYFDDFVEANAVSGSQVVFLGSGFDTRVYRLQLENVRAFELDCAEILLEKEKILGAESLKNGNEVTRIAVDLRENWVKDLLKGGFKKHIPTVWVIEGLLYYLSDSTVRHIMEKIDKLSIKGSSLIFDVAGTGLLELDSMSTYINRLRKSGKDLPFCMDKPEDLFMNLRSWKIDIDYFGSKTANYGRVKEFSQDLSKPNRSKLNSYFVVGKKWPTSASTTTTD